MEITERAGKYLATMEPSVSGAGGHNACYAAACALIHGFALDDAAALSLLASAYNPRCSPPWSDKELRHKVAQARKAASDKPEGYLVGRQRSDSKSPVTRPSAPTLTQGPEPEDRIKKRQAYDAAALQRMMCRGFSPSVAWLAEISPIDPRRVTSLGFLDAIFQPGEKTVIFLNFRSQGQFGHVAGSPGKTYRLGDRPGLRPVLADTFPTHGPEGAWFLPSPVDGKWHPSGRTDKAGDPVMSRRTGASITIYRHLLLESDNAPEDQWLNLLCQLPLPITALYTSGSRSIHALLRIDSPSKSSFDAFRDRLSPLLSKLGADPAAMSGVRLTRLPGFVRDGATDKDGRYVKFDPPRLQRLLYLNPAPAVAALKLMPRLRSVSSR